MAGYSNHSGKNQSGKVASGDPEVDERLKNIEPKMIELITNEVRSKLAQLYTDNTYELRPIKVP